MKNRAIAHLQSMLEEARQHKELAEERVSILERALAVINAPRATTQRAPRKPRTLLKGRNRSTQAAPGNGETATLTEN